MLHVEFEWELNNCAGIRLEWVPGALSMEIKRLGHEAGNLPPSSAEVKKGGAVPPLPHMSSWCHA
jgi:hypothetical protein